MLETRKLIFKVTIVTALFFVLASADVYGQRGRGGYAAVPNSETVQANENPYVAGFILVGVSMLTGVGLGYVISGILYFPISRLYSRQFHRTAIVPCLTAIGMVAGFVFATVTLAAGIV